MRITAGFFLVRKDYRILICHPTKAGPDVWSIPKGLLDNGEEPITAAIRETLEETNVDISKWKFIHRLLPVRYRKGKKDLYSFALFETQNSFDFDLFDFKCSSNVPDSIGGYPEIDDYKWATIEEARLLLHETQNVALNELENIINIIIKTKK